MSGRNRTMDQKQGPVRRGDRSRLALGFRSSAPQVLHGAVVQLRVQAGFGPLVQDSVVPGPVQGGLEVCCPRQVGGTRRRRGHPPSGPVGADGAEVCGRAG